MLITKNCIHCGETHTYDLPITEEQWSEYRKPGRRLVQDIMPQLNADQREFLISGLSPKCWNDLFGEDE